MTETEKKPRRYKFKEVCIRLQEGKALYSEESMDSPDQAVKVMRDEMAKFDREMLCVVNLNTQLKPINFNIVSIGTIDQTYASIANIFKSGILSNARSFMLMHNHPSGDTTPSQEDIAMTKQVIKAGQVIGIPCLDHIVIGGRTGDFHSMRRAGDISFAMPYNESLKETPLTNNYEKENTMAENMNVMYSTMESAAGTPAGAAEVEKNAEKKVEEISLKFSERLTEQFTGKSGKEYTKISIPNADANDHRPWASFVLPSKMVHENQFGKGLWVKLPADGKTTVTNRERVGEGPDGKGIWEDKKREVPNRELKSMMEPWKNRDKNSVLSQLSDIKKEPTAAIVKPKEKTNSMEL